MAFGEEKTFTLADVADAIEKNGLPQEFGNYFFYADEQVDKYDPSIQVDRDKSYPHIKVNGACALGMAAINLEVYEPDAWKPVEEDDIWLRIIQNAILRLNDDAHLSFKEIADEIRTKYRSYLNEQIKARGFEYTI